MAYMGSEIPPPTGENNLVIDDQTWSGSGKIDVTLVEVYGQDAWLVIYHANSDRDAAEPLFRALIAASTRGPTRAPVFPPGPDAAPVIKDIEGALAAHGRIELAAYLFTNNPPLDKFNHNAGPYPLDEPLTLASGLTVEYFWLNR
jgi:hypothetical protein